MKHEKLTEEVIIYILTRDVQDLSQLTRYKIAEKFNVNENYLSKRFKKDTRLSLFDYIERAQVNMAAELLRERKDLSVADVQRMVGVEKTQHFYKKFKKIWNISPTKYRDLFKDK
ncbi:MAG: helix-turn-helix transcriptional regulator [Candidatus Aminicenantes bacterium]|nr:MAG: helix-turn-helix transcriptional regulator [Candidatus Aminicenantes bacterium]